MDERLVGAWRLLSLRMKDEATGAITEPWGPQPQGRLILTAEGRLMTVSTAGNRLPPATDADAAALLNSMVCYSGRTRMESTSRWVTEVDVAWHPSWLGTQQARNFALQGDILSIHTDVMTQSADSDRPVSFLLSWQRER
jgi:hypothetical protein